MREALKQIEWTGDSLKRVRGFSKPVRQQVGYELELVQHSMEPSDWKPMAAIGPGVNEIRIHIHIEGDYRVFYVARLRHAIYVLHVLQKKSRKRPRPISTSPGQGTRKHCGGSR